MKNRAGCKASFILIVLLRLLTINVSANHTNTLQVSFINVGQGDSALIQDGNGFDVLIDGGRASAGPTVVAYIREQGVDDIEVMIASHADSDHIGVVYARPVCRRFISRKQVGDQLWPDHQGRYNT